MKNKQVQIESTLSLMSAAEVQAMVPKEVIDKIKTFDPHPVFAAMTVGYEGESTGKLYAARGEKAVWYKQLWPLKAVKQLVQALKHEIPIYGDRHDLEQVSYRQEIGRVVAATAKQIGKVTHAMAIAYMTDKVAIGKLNQGEYNACSMEAKCIFTEAENALRWIVEAVKEVTGVVIFNGEKIAPGFKNASIHAVIAAMSAEDNDDDEDVDASDKGKKRRKETRMEITLEDVKKFIEDKKLSPSQLFSTQTLLAEPKVVDAIDNEKKVAVADKDKKIGELEKENAGYKKRDANAKAASLIKKSALLKDESKECVAYLQRVLKLDITDESKAQEQVDAAIKEQLEVMKETGITFGKKSSSDDAGDDDDDSNGNDGKSSQNNDPPIKKKKDGDGNDDAGNEDDNFGMNKYMNPKNNPLIPK
jgi:hypothetical protein